MSITLRYMSTREEAEEALNDSFLKVFTNLKKFNSNLPFTSWIRKITINTCIDKLRRGIKLLTVHFNIEEIEQISVEDFEISSDEKILPILQELPPRYRLVFNLYVFEDYKHKEIAAKLKISEGTSKSNYARAKSLLKKKLGRNPKMLRMISHNYESNVK